MEVCVCFLAIPTYQDEEGTGCWFILSFLVALFVSNTLYPAFNADLLITFYVLVAFVSRASLPY